MIVVHNNFRYAPDDNTFINSLFSRKGTCDGYYEKKGKLLFLYTHRMKKDKIILVSDAVFDTVN
jgi:hypothetical protein